MTQIEMNGLSVAEKKIEEKKQERIDFFVYFKKDEDDFDEMIKAVKYHEHDVSVNVCYSWNKEFLLLVDLLVKG